MDVEQALFTHLRATTAVTSLTSDRIYPLVAEQGVSLPYITYQLISNPSHHAMIADPPIKSPRYQISSFSTSRNGMIAVSTQIKSTLRDKKGTLGTSNFVVQRIFLDSEHDLPEIDPQTERIIHRRVQDFIIWTTC